MIERTKSAPLFISCSNLGDQGLDEITSVVMSNIHRIQELDLGSSDADKLFDFLRLNNGASAPILQVLILRRHITPLPNDILERRMDSLQELKIADGTLTFPLPSFPRLKRLTIRPRSSDYSQHPDITALLPIDVLLESLRNAPNIEELCASQLRAPADASVGLKRPVGPVVHLPRLTSLDICGPAIGSSKLFPLLRYPESANIKYCCRDPIPRGSDMSDHRNALSEFSSSPGRIICGVLFSADPSSRTIKLDTFLGCSSHSFALTLPCVSKDDLAQILSVTPFSKTTSLEFSDLYSDVLQPSRLFEQSDYVEVLTLYYCKVEYLRGLMKLDGSKLPLPRLRTLILADSRVCNVFAEERDTVMCDAILSLLIQRKDLGVEIRELTIRHCDITKDIVNRLGEYVKVNWDS
ncbi:hypothetical protein ONZ45_g7044 [Pleurotus djamor]|nr:hypothetical protein ONZ45_g7044 [Pleurotus djamor]